MNKAHDLICNAGSLTQRVLYRAALRTRFVRNEHPVVTLSSLSANPPIKLSNTSINIIPRQSYCNLQVICLSYPSTLNR